MTITAPKPAKGKSAISVENAADTIDPQSALRENSVQAAQPIATRPGGRWMAASANTKDAPARASKAAASRAPRKATSVKKAQAEPAGLARKVAKKSMGKAKKVAKKSTVKVKKPKQVRDSFTMPDVEYDLILALKRRCLSAGVSAKKSEILRAAVANLARLTDASVLAALRRLEVIKIGRPSKKSK